MAAIFRLNGKAYPIPQIEELTIGEQIILHGYSNVTIDKVEEMDSPAGHPGIMAGLLHLAIHRGDPDRSEREIREIVQAANYIKVLADIEVEPDDEEAAASADPPSPPPSEESSNGSDENAGDAGTNVTEAPQLRVIDQSSSGQQTSERSATSA